MNPDYRTDENRIHFYRKRKDGSWLHVVAPTETKTVTAYHNDQEYEHTFVEGNCLINAVDHLPSPAEERLIMCRAEDFDNALRYAIFNLQLYNYI